jgi:hypothetical protein
MAVTVEVADGQGPAELVLRLGAAGHPAAALPEGLAASAGQPTGRAIQHVHRSRIQASPDVLARDANRQVAGPVAVEVPGGQGMGEHIGGLGGAGRPAAALPEPLAAGWGQAGRRPVEHAQRAPVHRASDILEGNTDREVGERVAVEVAAGQRGAELVASANNSPIPIQIPARVNIAVVADMSAHLQPIVAGEDPLRRRRSTRWGPTTGPLGHSAEWTPRLVR